MENLTAMDLDQFTAEFETLQDEGREKEAALLAGSEPDLYARYFTEVLGEETDEEI